MEENWSKKKKVKMIILALVVLLLISISVFYWISNRNYITTDNAQLDCNIVTIKSGVTAYMDSIGFSDNDYVKKGQILFVLDTADLGLKVEQADAELDIAEAKLEAAKGKASASSENASAGDLTAVSYEQSIVSAKASLDNAQNAFDRIRNLLKIKAATQEEYEKAETKLAISKADYAKAISLQKSSSSSSLGLKSLARSDGNQISLAEAQVRQCEAELLLAKNRLGDAFIRAPGNGIVSKRAVQKGQYVVSGQNLCALVDNENIWVTANFKETQLNKIKIGQHVKIKVDAYPDFDLTGKIESFSGATGAKYSLLPADNATGNFIKITQRVPVKISLDHLTRDLMARLFPGFSVFVKVYTD